MRKILGILIITVVIGSLLGCDPYAKVRKSGTIAEKDTAAMYYYKKEKYDLAAFMFEELRYLQSGSRAIDMQYYFAYSKYHLGELLTASLLFENFVLQYPNDPRAEEMHYMEAYCNFLLSDPYYLDQKFTYRAIEKIQLYLSRYPYTTRKEECNKILRTLRERLAFKAFQQAELYHKIGYHKAAVQAFTNVMNDYPDSKYREKAQFLQLKSAIKLADISILTKRVERYQTAQAYYDKFNTKYPESEYSKQARMLSVEAKKGASKAKMELAYIEAGKTYDAFKKQMQAVERKPEQNADAYENAIELYKVLKDDFSDTKYYIQAEKYLRKYEKLKSE